MTVEIEVRHETSYTYGQPVELAHHIAFLRPRDEEGGQRLLSFSLDADPAPAGIHHEVDAFGNTRTLFSLHAPHEALRVTACSRVELAPAEVSDGGMDAQAAREHWRYCAGRAPDSAVGFVFASPLVPLADELRDWASSSFPAGRSLTEGATALMVRLHEEFEYDPQSTHVGTPLLEAFRQRRGVCQDYAHVMIGALRSMGLAARYVSGYLLTEPPPGQPRLQGADASHAWLAVALPREDGGAPDWLELDPTNACVAGTGHVRVAFGRDYGDVTPLRGVIRGGGAHQLAVAVATRVVSDDGTVRAN